MEELVKNNVILWALGLLISGFVAGIVTYKTILSIAHLKVISLYQWDSINALIGGSVASNKNQVSKLSTEEQALLYELVAESKGIGDSVAVYPFESNIRRINIPLERARITIASLQERGFVLLTEDAGWDNIENRATTYPIYRVTKEGFRWAIQNRS